MASHPTKIGKYNVEGVLGRGGMGVVYKAVDQQIGRYVAIKMILSGGDQSLLERFHTEARSTGSLQCPNIVTVYDFGEQDGNPYLVMQFLEGSSLESMIQKGVQLTLSERLGVIIDVCNGLAYAHQRGVIHRDIKPANIMVLQDGVNDGMGVIVDFGIARIGGSTRLTRTDQIIGSVHYMSAEQLQAKELDNRTDIYATGVVLFQLLTGALPFDAPETAATLLKIVNEPPPPLSTYLKEYPVELEAIISRALAKKREDRYPSAKELAFDLMQVQEHLKSETVVQLIRRAEASLGREEWTRAREQLQQVLRIDRQNTQAQKMMNSVQERLRQQQQIEQARALRSQADEAYMDQRYEDALRLLDQAVVLDPKNNDLQTLRESVRLSKERATGLRRALRRAEAALQDGDLDEAQSAVVEAFDIDPHDTQAKALKVIISQHADERVRQQQLQKLLDKARNLIAARDLPEAFVVLKEAEELDPTSNDLQSVAKMALSARDQEKRRAETEELRRLVEAALVHEDYATAVAKAEEGLRKYPQEQSLLKLKTLAEAQRARIELKKFVREQFASASALADAGQLAQALAVLDRALQRAPGNSELETLRSTLKERVATEQSEQQKLRALDQMLAEARRIFQERGARGAREFLDALSAPYAEFPQVRELYESVRAREGLDVLDGKLANESNPAKRVQLAEDAARANPGNGWIRQRLADLQQVRSQISAAIERAEGFETSGRMSEAIREWQQLRSTYPDVPEFGVQLRRLASPETERVKTATPAIAPDESLKHGDPGRPASSSTSDLSATRVIDSVVVPDAAPTRQVPTAERRTSDKTRGKPPTKKVEPPRPVPPKPPEPKHDLPRKDLLAGQNKFLALVAVIVILFVVGYLILGGGKAVTVRVTSDPAGTEVTVGGQGCRAPCDLKLKPGEYQLQAVHDGYQRLKQDLVVSADTKSWPLTLIPIAPAPPPGKGTLTVQTNVDGVEVFVDGASKGRTGHDRRLNVELNEGSHEVRVKMDGYDQVPAQTAVISKDVMVPLPFKLTKTTAAQGYLEITSKAGAEVFIDHQLFGHVTASGSFSVQVKPTTHLLELKLAGYKIWSEKRSVESDGHLPVKADLTPLPAEPKPLPVVAFRASTETIQQGQPATLSWDTQNADQVEIDQGIGTVDKSSSRQVSPTASIIYTLTAKGQGGTATGTAKINVIVAPPPPQPKPVIDEFSPIPDTVRRGQSTKLYWHTQNAAEVSIDQNVGSGLPISGSRSVTPSATSKYTLTVKGADGTVMTQSTTVTVEGDPPPPPATDNDVQACVKGFKDAYESMDISKLTKVWPSLAKDSKRRKAIEESFNAAKAIKLDEQQCSELSAIPDSLHFQCRETMVYTLGRQQQKPQQNTIEFTCRKVSGEWVIESHSVR